MLNQLRIAVRALAKAPAFTIVALVVLALGIGSGTAIFSVVDAVVLRGLPYDEHDRIMAVLAVDTKHDTTFGGGSSTTQSYLDWRKLQQSFDGVALAGSSGFRLKTENGQPADARAEKVTSEFFSVLHTNPLFGRKFDTNDEIAGRNHVVLLSYGFWQSHFGGADDVVGKKLDLNEDPWEIVGVLPRGFQYPVSSDHPTDLYVPQAFTPADIERKGSHNYNGIVIGRLKHGVTVEQANDEMNRIAKSLDEQYPKWEPGWRVHVEPLQEFLVGKVRGWLLMLLGAVALVLLIACGNVANLMLARATAQSRETGIRAALGAGRWTLVRGLLTEGLLLSLSDALIGVLLAYGGVDVLRVWLPSGLPRVSAIAIDWRVLGFAIAAAVSTGIVFSIFPALQASRPNITEALKDGGRSMTTGVSGQRLCSALVVTEVALSVVLMVGAGLFIRSFSRLVSIDPGFDYHNVLTLGVSLRVDYSNPNAYKEALPRGAAYVQQMIDAIRRVPGIEMVGAVDGGVPLTGSWSRTRVTLPNQAELPNEDSIDTRQVTTNYLSLLKIPLLRGRGLNEGDGAAATPVIVINQAAAQKYWPGRDPLGEHITYNSKDRVVVGIVGNIRHLGPESPVRPEAYSSMAQEQTTGASLVIRTKGDPFEVLPGVKAAIWSVNPEQHLNGDVVTLEGYMDRLIAERRFTMALLALFGFLGLTIAAVGIYGVMAYVVAQRTNEIGVRMALGARPLTMLAMVLKHAAMLTVMGLGIGAAGAWWLSAGVGKFLFQVQPSDRLVFAASLITLLLTALLASAIPPWRAAAVDPLVALRHE